MSQRLIFAFVKASGILSCRAAVATLPRSMSEAGGGAAVTEEKCGLGAKDRGSERAREEGRLEGRTKYQCDWGLKRSHWMKILWMENICVLCSSLFDTAVNPLMFVDLLFLYFRPLSPVLVLFSVCFVSLTLRDVFCLWQYGSGRTTRIQTSAVRALPVDYLNAGHRHSGDTFTLTCAPFGGPCIMSTQTKHRSARNLSARQDKQIKCTISRLDSQTVTAGEERLRGFTEVDKDVKLNWRVQFHKNASLQKTRKQSLIGVWWYTQPMRRDTQYWVHEDKMRWGFFLMIF